LKRWLADVLTAWPIGSGTDKRARPSGELDGGPKVWACAFWASACAAAACCVSAENCCS
jgi:hypothetical protein